MMLRFDELRADFNMKQREIAEVLNVKEDTYSKWERGINDISLEKCNELVCFYHTSFDYLLGLSKKRAFLYDNFEINWRFICSNLRRLRKENNLTQTYLSRKLGFPQTTYSQYEVGTSHPTTLKLLAIAQYYNVSFDFLVGRSASRTVLVNESFINQ